MSSGRSEEEELLLICVDAVGVIRGQGCVVLLKLSNLGGWWHRTW